jgi:hypothetical protein
LAGLSEAQVSDSIVIQKKISGTVAKGMGLPDGDVSFNGASSTSRRQLRTFRRRLREDSEYIEDVRAAAFGIVGPSSCTISTSASVPLAGSYSAYAATPDVLYDNLSASFKTFVTSGAFAAMLASLGVGNITASQPIVSSKTIVYPPAVSPTAGPSAAPIITLTLTEATTFLTFGLAGIGAAVMFLGVCLLAYYFLYHRPSGLGVPTMARGGASRNQRGGSEGSMSSGAGSTSDAYDVLDSRGKIIPARFERLVGMVYLLHRSNDELRSTLELPLRPPDSLVSDILLSRRGVADITLTVMELLYIRKHVDGIEAENRIYRDRVDDRGGFGVGPLTPDVHDALRASGVSSMGTSPSRLTHTVVSSPRSPSVPISSLSAPKPAARGSSIKVAAATKALMRVYEADTADSLEYHETYPHISDDGDATTRELSSDGPMVPPPAPSSPGRFEAGFIEEQYPGDDDSSDLARLAHVSPRGDDQGSVDLTTKLSL